jgi:hypothetical protein
MLKHDAIPFAVLLVRASFSLGAKFDRNIASVRAARRSNFGRCAGHGLGTTDEMRPRGRGV